MIAWFIIAIATLAVFGFIAANGVQTVSMSSDAGGRVETVRRLDAAVRALTARALSPDANGIAYLPVGTLNPDGEGYGLPADMTAMSVTPFGRRLVYCPFGDNGYAGTALSILSANGSSYTVTTKIFEGKAYVVGGRPSFPQLAAQPNILAFVLAPKSKSSVSPSCNQVVYDNGKFVAAGAVVRVITRDGGIDETRTNDARKLTFFVTPNGTGSGASPSDPASLATATMYYRSKLPAYMTINMSSGNFTMGATDLRVVTQTSNVASHLILNGVKGSTNVDMTGQGDLQIPGHLGMTGVLFDQDVNVSVQSGSRFEMRDSSVGSIKSNGEVLLSGANAITQSKNEYAIQVLNNGIIDISGTVNFFNLYGNGLNAYGNGVVSLNGAQLNFYTGSSAAYKVGLGVASAARANIDNSVLNFPVGTNYGVLSYGYVSLISSKLNFGGAPSGSAIQSLMGSRLGIMKSQIGLGVQPYTGIYESGAAHAFGGETTIYARSNCWSGNLFADSGSGHGASSSVLADIDPGVLPEAPTPSQIQAFTTIQTQNARKGARRVNNASDWICVM